MKIIHRSKQTRFGRFGAAVAAMAVYAGDVAAQTVPSSEPGWHFAVTPYGWLPTVDGKFRYDRLNGGGAKGADVSVDPINLVEALNFAAMIAAEARYDRFSISTDFLYLNLGNSASSVRSVDFAQFGRNPVSSTLNAGTESSLRGSIWALAGGYTLANGTWGHVDAQAGMRWFSLSTSTDVRLSADVAGPGQGQSFARSGRLSRSADLFDGIVGLRGRFELGSGFYLPYAFDVGAGSSRLTWQASGGVGYQSGWAGVNLGYRHLSYEQGSDKLVQNLSLSGPFVALNIPF